MALVVVTDLSTLRIWSECYLKGQVFWYLQESRDIAWYFFAVDRSEWGIIAFGFNRRSSPWEVKFCTSTATSKLRFGQAGKSSMGDDGKGRLQPSTPLQRWRLQLVTLASGKVSFLRSCGWLTTTLSWEPKRPNDGSEQRKGGQDADRIEEGLLPLLISLARLSFQRSSDWTISCNGILELRACRHDSLLKFFQISVIASSSKSRILTNGPCTDGLQKWGAADTGQPSANAGAEPVGKCYSPGTNPGSPLRASQGSLQNPNPGACSSDTDNTLSSFLLFHSASSPLRVGVKSQRGILPWSPTLLF